jgi:dienelactone hydrolase
MSLRRWAVAATGLVLLLVAAWQIQAAAWGIEIVTLRSSTPPLMLVGPKGADLATRPLVLVGHGFAGSAALMRGFAYTLAHAGYAVAAWDFHGHGANPQALAADMGGHALLADAEAALAEANARGWGDAAHTAILGHSMGSGAALAYGTAHPGTAATIAVSPVPRGVTLELPHNLLLMAGSREPGFVRNAEQLLSEAGGAGGDPAAGTAREIQVIPGVEHLSILFSPTAHAAARQWLDATFGVQPGAADYADRRVLWYGLGLVGLALLATGLGPLAAEQPAARKVVRPLAWRAAAVVGGAMGATLVLWLAARAGLGTRDLLGLLVGGYLMVWFGVAGALSLFLLWARLSWPSRRALMGGLLAFCALWLGVGLLGQSVWLPWLLIPRRLALWPLGALLMLPWFLAAGEAIGQARPPARLGWWLLMSGAVAGSLVLALRLSPDLGFLILILPLFPVVLGLHALVAGPLRGSWSFALSGALFTSWLLLAVFPLQ